MPMEEIFKYWERELEKEAEEMMMKENSLIPENRFSERHSDEGGKEMGRRSLSSFLLCVWSHCLIELEFVWELLEIIV